MSLSLTIVVVVGVYVGKGASGSSNYWPFHCRRRRQCRSRGR